MPDTTITANVRAIAEKWPGITRVVGQVEARPIAGKDTYSEHSFGNALDIYGSRRAMSSLAAHLNSTKNQTGVRIVCYDGGPGPSYDKCTTKHLDHIHVDMVPNCGGIVAVTRDKSTQQLRDECEEYQQGGNVKPDDNRDDAKEGGGGINLNPFSGVAESIENVRQDIGDFVRTGFFVVLGAGVVAAGVYMAIKDTDTFKALQGAAKTAITKGAA